MDPKEPTVMIDGSRNGVMKPGKSINGREYDYLPGHYGKEGKGEIFNSYIQTISVNSNAYEQEVIL